MNLDIDTASEKAMDFLSRAGYSFKKMIKAHYDDGKWIIEINVGVFSDEVKKVIIDDKTEKVISYE